MREYFIRATRSSPLRNLDELGELLLAQTRGVELQAPDVASCASLHVRLCWRNARRRDIGARNWIACRQVSPLPREVRTMAEEQVLAGKAAIVTGAANGMGRVMARALGRAGAKVAGVDRDAAGLDRLGAEAAFANGFLGVAADVSKTADCQHAVENVGERFGGLDI